MTPSFLKNVLFFLLFLNYSRSNAGGNAVGNGGDALSLQFRGMIHSLLSAPLSANTPIHITKILKQMSSSLSDLKVETTSNLFLGSREVDFINYPIEKKIVISRTRWPFFETQSFNIQSQLVMHEILGANGYNDNDYSLSILIMSFVKIKTWDKPIQSIGKVVPLVYIISANQKRVIFSFHDSPDSDFILQCSIDNFEFSDCPPHFVVYEKNEFETKTVLFRYRSRSSNETSPEIDFVWFDYNINDQLRSQ